MPDHDPVNAISEAEATGHTAEIFAEIRKTMQIPLVTSIWRTLDAIDGGLETAWAATKPIYESGHTDVLLSKLRAEIDLPTPKTFSTDEWKSLGIDSKDRASIVTILEAYNRSNTLNLIALTALVRNGSSKSPGETERPRVEWPELPTLMSKAEIKPEHWTLLEQTIPLGVNLPTSALPTLWRHLIHWPMFIECMLKHYRPLHENGKLFDMVDRVTNYVETHAPTLSHFRDDSFEIPEAARQMIEQTVHAVTDRGKMLRLSRQVGAAVKLAP